MSVPQTISGQNIVLNSNNNIFLDATRTVINGLLSTKNPKGNCALTVKNYSNNTISASDISNGVIIFNENSNTPYPYVNYAYDLYQNPYMVDSSMFYATGSNAPSGSYLNNPSTDINNLGNLIGLALPTDLSTVLRVGESAELTIINNGNSALRLLETANELTVGFDLVYDATSAKFIVKRETNTLTYYVRSA